MPAPLRLIPFQSAHAAALTLRPGAAEVLSGLGDVAALAQAYAAAGPCWTVLAADGSVAACGGAVRFWAGVGECWCWAGAGLEARAVAFARLARRAVAQLSEAHGFRRLQAHVREGDGRAERFVRHLGFELEGRCPGFGPDGAAHNLYGRYGGWKA
jgi:hypothetical protein